MTRITTLRTKLDTMTPETFARAIASIEQKYGLRLDARSVWLRMDDTPCGRGWVGTKPNPGCKRPGKTTAGTPMKVQKKVPKTKDPEMKPNEAEVLKSTLQRLKAKLEESIAKDNTSTKPPISPVKAATKTAEKSAKPTATPTKTLVKSPSVPSKPAAIPVKAQGTGIAPYTVKKKLGEGAFGKAELTDRGTVVKTSTGFEVSNEEVKREFDGVKHIHKLGLGPEAIGLEGKTIEIGLVKGKPLVKIKDEESQMSAQMEAAKALLKLHKSGWSHNDAHDENLILQKDGKVKLIDAGMAMPVGGKISERSDGSGIFSRAGIADIDRIAYTHPAVRELRKALKKDLDEHWKVISQTLNNMDESKRSEMKQSAEIKLHKAYLAIADQYIK